MPTINDFKDRDGVFVGNFDVLKEAAKALGYEFILWNGKVYWACGAGTLYTEKDIQ